MLVAGRFINGFSVGICSAQGKEVDHNGILRQSILVNLCLVPVYVSELAPPSKRGRVVGAQQWAITWGILIMFYISYGCSFIDGPTAFRVPWGLQMIPAVILFFGTMFLPESPRFAALLVRAKPDLFIDVSKMASPERPVGRMSPRPGSCSRQR